MLVTVIRRNHQMTLYKSRTIPTPQNINREEKSLRHVAMVATFLDDNKLSLKNLFTLFHTSPILFNVI